MEVFDPRYCADLGGGFLVKWADPREAAAYGALCDVVFRRSGDAPIRENNAVTVAEWVNQHPNATEHDIAVVVDEADTVVAGAILLRQQMDYAGVQLQVGRPELVVCHPDFRNRGYIRHIFGLLHAKSHARGDALQAITGIPYYYRQFGYGYAIDSEQQCVVHCDQIPAPRPSEISITLRLADASEYRTFVALYDADRLGRGLLCTTPIEHSYFTNLRSGSRSVNMFDPVFICNESDGSVIGYLLVHRGNYNANIAVLGAGVRAGMSWQRLLTPILHALASYRERIIIMSPTVTALTGITFVLDSVHPVYEQLRHGYTYKAELPTAWYIRVPDFQRLFSAMTPILEARISHSSMVGHTGTLAIACYGQGCTLDWHDGRLSAIRNTRPAIMGDGADTCLPLDTFLMVIFGRKSYAEIRQWHHEVRATVEAEQLLGILFPKQPSWFQWLN